MKFVFGVGETLRPELSKIPWIDAFLPSKILVVGVDGKGRVGAVCGIRSRFNILTLYVCKGYRGQGIGRYILDRTVNVARRSGLGFILLGMALNNRRAFRLYSRFGFREIVCLRSLSLRVMMLPICFASGFTCVLLRKLLSLLPNNALSYVAREIHNRTIAKNEVAGHGC